MVFVGFFRTDASCEGVPLDETLERVDCCWVLSVDSGGMMEICGAGLGCLLSAISEVLPSSGTSFESVLGLLAGDSSLSFALFSGEHVLLPSDWVNGQGRTFAGVYVFNGAFFVGTAGDDVDMSSIESWDMAMAERKSSTCLRDREL